MYSLEIKGLFGDRNIKFQFQKPLIILIGENGIGKSTVLGILNCILSKNLKGLQEYDFSSIIFSANQIELKLNKDDLDKVVTIGNLNLNNLIKHMLNDKSLIRDLGRELEMPFSRIEMYFEEWEIEKIKVRRNTIKNRGLETPISDDILEFIGNEEYRDVPLVESFIDPIISEFKGELLYFPTYRRIEEESFKLGRVLDGDLGKDVIKFGMQDVKKIFDSITSQIKKQTLDGVQNVMDSLFSDLLSEMDISNKNLTNNLKNKREDLEIILQRSEKNLPLPRKETLQIIDVILNKENLTDKEQFILYFISKYLKIYESSKIYDERIYQFIDVCNSYFNDKEFHYDNKNVEINLYSKYDLSREIQLKGLSSGEKQIVSLFAKLYLTGSDNFIILFDEPELSLSIYWQEKLINNILESKKCEFMMVVTHSPFIVPKELKKYTLSFGSTVQRKEGIYNE